MKYLAILITILAIISPIGSQAQTEADSLTILTARWDETTPARGIKSRCAAFDHLYGGPQYVSIVEIAPKQKRRAGIGTSKTMKTISQLAHENKAIAAVNGSYFNMREGNSVCFLKIDKAVADSTEAYEFDLRVTGAVAVRKGRLSILPWSRSIERNYKKRHGTVLASGPLMLDCGRYADWTVCDEKFVMTKHPRSAVAVTKDGRILLITVDGRSRDHAFGMNIPELAHLLKTLGAHNALNLDGGGSTMLYLDGHIINHPCDNRRFDHEGERRIPNIVYFR